MRNRAPDQVENANNGVKSAVNPPFSSVLQSFDDFVKGHNRQFFRYKDLQSENLFGPTMAFRVTRTPGWLSPVAIAGQPKYLPEAVFAVVNRLAAAK